MYYTNEEVITVEDLQAMLMRINNTRKEKNYTIKDLSKITNISISTLGKILSGIVKEPSITSINKIAKALNVSVDYLVFGENTTIEEPLIIKYYNKLNAIGKQKADEYIQDLSEQAKYTINSDSDHISDDIINELKQVTTAPMSDTIKQK